MPQFLPGDWLPQLVWLGLIFAVLYFLVVRPTLPKVARVIDEREGRVAGDLDAAEAAKGEADSIRTRYDDGMAAARQAAQAEVGAARDAAARTSEAQLREVGAGIDAKAAAAAAALATARDEARAKLSATAAELAREAVTRLTGIEVDPADVDAALAAQK